MKTPQLPAPRLAAKLGISGEVWLKREDKHHYGSHKGRSIPAMIAQYVADGQKSFVISSSGNAALAAALAVVAHNKNKPQNQITLHIFIGNEINAEKKLHIETAAAASPAITITQAANPKQQALQMQKEQGTTLLRQSTDERALTGYAELAAELAKIPNLAAVFIPTSSGTTAVGLHLGFATLGLQPEIHIVQTSACHPIADAFYTQSNQPLPVVAVEKSLADAIVDIVGHRKIAVADVLQKTNGAAWVATNKHITEAIALTKETTDITVSPTSALAVAGLTLAKAAGRTWGGPVVCLITGA